jgi:hypothetical protein
MRSSRRAFLKTATFSTAVLSGTASVSRSKPTDGQVEFKPLDALQTMLTVLGQFPLVALAERHTLQEWHDFVTALLFHPDLPGKITDIVVEFGNSRFQDLADRFVLECRPVAKVELRQIWRQIGDPSWNAPIYEQFFHTVRAINWMQPPKRRIRVLLGQPPITMTQVLENPKDKELSKKFTEPMDAHYADLVKREVMAKGRRALLTGGGGHMLRGVHAGSNDKRPNAATRLANDYPGKIFVVDLLLLPLAGSKRKKGGGFRSNSRDGHAPPSPSWPEPGWAP